MRKFFICIMIVALPQIFPSLRAQTRDVVVDVNGVVLAPPNFAQANQFIQNVETVGGPLLPNYFELGSETFYSNVVGSTSTNTVTDAVQVNWTTSTSQTDYKIITQNLRNSTGGDITWTSSNPAVATVSADGFVSYVSSGAAQITGTLGNFTQALDLTFSALATDFTQIIAGVQPYLRYDLTAAIDAALAADAGAYDDELFDTRDWTAHIYVRNASAWAYAATGGTAPWTGLAVWRTGKTSTALGQSIRGTLISPDTIAFAWHNHPAIGTEYKYLGTDNVVYTRSVTKTVRVGSGDAGIGLLDSPLPAEVQPVNILPVDIFNGVLTQGSWGYQLPVIAVNRNLQAMVADVYQIQPSTAIVTLSQIDSRRPYYQQQVNGDSGSPVLLVLDGSLVLLMTWMTPTYGFHFIQNDNMSAALTTLGGIAPTVVDLSTYPQSGPPTL